MVLDEISAIISRNLGARSANLFREFYQGDATDQQMKGAEDLLADILGRKKAREQLQVVYEKAAMGGSENGK